LTIDTVKEIKEGDPLPPASGGNRNTMNTNKNAFDTQLNTAAQQYGINCTFLKAFMITESSANPNAVSPAGAIGLMQLMPDTARGLKVDPNNLKDPTTNINAGAKYIKQLLSTACNNQAKNSACDVKEARLRYVIASYNGGPRANKESSSCPGKTWWECEANYRYQETRNYVQKVLDNYDKMTQNGWGC
jgi:soluble lytic murein transglycosylase-like protein